MKIKDFIEKVKNNGGYKDNKEARQHINVLISSIQEVLESGDSITFNSFGTFNNITRAAREGVVPNTNKKFYSEAKKTIKFTPTAKYKEKLNS